MRSIFRGAAVMLWRLLPVIFILPMHFSFAASSDPDWLRAANWLIGKAGAQKTSLYETPMLKSYETTTYGKIVPIKNRYRGVEVAVNAGQMYFVAAQKGWMLLLYGTPGDDARRERVSEIVKRAATEIERASGERIFAFPPTDRFDVRLGAFTLTQVKIHLPIKAHILSRFMEALHSAADCEGSLADWSTR
jgi:hypothetical protein